MKVLGILGAIGVAVGISGCMIVESPIRGVMGTEVKWGEEVTGRSSSPDPDKLKEGKACAESILGLVARGDATVTAAKENGGIREVHVIDHTARNFLGVVGEWCTIVRGI